jgi:hypothetical protein
MISRKLDEQHLAKYTLYVIPTCLLSSLQAFGRIVVCVFASIGIIFVGAIMLLAMRIGIMET